MVDLEALRLDCKREWFKLGKLVYSFISDNSDDLAALSTLLLWLRLCNLDFLFSKDED